MGYKKVAYVISGGAIVLMGCATSVSNFQSGKTLSKGQFELGTSCGLGVVSSEDIETHQKIIRPCLPLEGWIRYGVYEKFDAGVKVSSFAAATLDIRRSLKDERKEDKFSLALGLGFSTCSYTEKTTQGDTLNPTAKDSISVAMKDVSLTSYFSKDLDGILTFYGCPKYVFRIEALDKLNLLNNKRTKGTLYSNFLGLGLGVGLNIGKVLRIMGEINYLQNIRNIDFCHIQCGMGMSFIIF